MIEVVETAACEVSPVAASIPHNYKTLPRHARGLWFMSAISTDTEFVFVHATTLKKRILRAEDGWTRADAESFHTMLIAQ